MNLRPLDWLAWLLAFAITIGLFLPWLKFPSRIQSIRPARAAIVEELTADSDRPFGSVWFGVTPEEWKRATRNTPSLSGIEIPGIFRDAHFHRQAGLLVSSGLLGSERQPDRANIVYVFPVIGYLAAAFVTWAGRKFALLLPLLVGGALYALARYQINTTSLERFASSLDIGLGLWLSLYALLGLIAVLILRMLLPVNSRI